MKKFKLMALLLVSMLSINVWALTSVAPANGKTVAIVAVTGTSPNEKYYALPQISSSASAATFDGVEISVNNSGYAVKKVGGAEVPTWTLVKNPSNANQYYIAYTTANESTYYLYKNGTSSSTNYNIKVVNESSRHYWTFTTSGNGYSIKSERGSAAQYLQLDNNNKFKVNTTQALYLLELAPSYTITAVSNNTSYGTVELSGDVITASPKSGYTYANPAYTVTSGSAEVEQDGDKFTVKTTADCTVRINFAIKQTATIKLSEAGIITDGPSGKYSGDQYTLPTTCNQSCGDKTFVGWSTETVDSETKPTANTYHEPGEEVTLAANNTFYAVFADASSGGGVLYKKVSSISAGTYILVSEKTTNTFKYMPNTESSGSNPSLGSGITMTTSGDVTKLTNSVTDAMLWDLTSTGTTNEYYIRPKGSTTIGLGTTNSTGENIRISSTYKNTKWTITTSTNCNWQFKNNNTTAMYLAVYADNAWRNYSNNTTNQNGKFYLFKEESNITYSNYTTTCRSLTKIEVSTEPNKKIYTVGDNFDPTGLVIKATYDSGDPEYITYSGNESKFTFTPLLTTALTAGNTSVTIGYGGLFCTQNITVNAKAALESISVNTDNCQTNFIKNEEFNSTGLVVTAHYVGGATETVTSSATIDASAYVKGTANTYTINVSYTDESGTKETSYNVNVWELSASSSNTNLGTVGRSAYVITGNPKTGVTYADPAYTVTKGSADVVQGTDANINKFTVSNVTANTTVTINFVEKDKDTYIDQMHGQLTTGNVFYDSYNAPNINYSHTTTGDNCQDGHIYFAGWSATSSQVGSATAPADMFAAGASKTASGATYYAVWAKGENSAPATYTKVTTISEGTYLMATGQANHFGTSTSPYAYAGVKNEFYGEKVAVSVTNGVISTKPETAKELTVTLGTGANASYFAIYDGSAYLSMTEKSKFTFAEEPKYEWELTSNGYIHNKGTYDNSSQWMILFEDGNSGNYATLQYFHPVKDKNEGNNNSQYYYHAFLFKKQGGLSYTDYLTACCTPLVVTGLEVTAQTTNSLSFSWDGVANATGYEYKLSTADAWAPTTGTSATISGLEAATEYTIQVRATDNTGNYCAAGTIAEVKKMTYYNTEIYISTPPKKTVYVEGETFDNDEMVVWYTHEATKTSVSSQVTFSTEPLVAGTTSITISYNNGNETLTTSQAITVKAKWTVLYYINGAEYKRYCAQGDAAEVPTVAGTELEPTGFTFTGWVTAAMAAESETEPSYVLAKNATSYTPTSNNAKLYSVYKREEVTVKEGYKLYETTNSKWVGPRSGTDSYFTYKTDASQAEIFLIDQTEGQIAYISNGKPMYFYGYAKNSTISFKTTLDENGAWAIVNIENDIYTFQASGEYYLAYNTNQPRFATYSGNSNGKFSLTPAKIEMSQSYYNTKAEVPNVHHIAIKTAPTTTTYFEGDKFDAAGLVVWAYYSADDKVGKEVPASQYTLQIGTETDLDNYELKAVDDHVVISFRNAQCSQPITVNAITLNSITVTTPPTQTKYTPGAAFNPEGMVVFAVYNDTRKNKDVPLKVDDADGYTYSPATLTKLGEQDVTISYTDGTRGTQTTTTPVIVNSALNEIRVKTNPDKMNYIEGELFDKTGMVVEGSYGESADWKDITGWTYEPTTAIVAKGTLTEAAQQDITIHYSESGVDKETVLKVMVQPYPRYTVTFSVNGNTDLQLTETDPEGGIIIPANPANIGDYTFVGWAEATMAAESPEKPAMIAEAVGATYHITADKTLYAVYSMEKDAAIYGNIVSVVSNSKTYYLKSREDNDKKYFRCSESKADALLIYQQEGNLLYVGSGNTKYYFYNSSSSDLAFTTTKPNSDNWTITTNNGITTVYCSSTSRYLAFNNRFAAYQDNVSYPHDLIFEKTEESIILKVPHYTTSPETAKTPVVKFTTSTASTPVLTNDADHTSLATYFNNTLSTENKTGAVVYSLADGDDAVATIATDGTVTAKKAGSVTVTATVGAVAGVWKEASASYTLTFNKMTPSVQFTDPITTVYGGNTYTYVATTTSDGTVQYSMANETNATIGQTDGQLVVKEYSTITSTTKSATIYATVPETDLYKATTNSTRGSIALTIKSNGKKQTLTFATPEGYDFAPKASVEPFINTLNGAKTTVTYSLTEGSTAGLVTVNETTGEVTVNTNLSGSATVVATAKEDNITEDGTIWAYQEATAEYTINVSYFRPVLTLTPGLDTQQELWRCTQTVTMTAQEGDKIYYTINGGDPTTSSTLYENPFEVNDQMVNTDLQVIIKAIAVSSDGSMTSPILTKTLTKAVPTMTAKAKDVDVTSDSEIKLDANDVVTLKATACKIDYRIRNHEGTEIEKKVGNATTDITFTKGGTFTLEATPRWSNTNGFKGETQSWTVKVKGAGHLPINYNEGGSSFGNYAYWSTSGDGTISDYDKAQNTKIQMKPDAAKSLSVQVSFVEEPTTVSYYAKHNKGNLGWADCAATLIVEESANGTNWTTIKEHTATSNPLDGTNETSFGPYDLKSTTRYVRWTYSKPTSNDGNLGLGNIHIGTTTLIVDDSKDLDPDFSGNVIVENGGKLTVVNMSTISDLTIEPGGIVDAHTYTNAALTVNNLYLQSADHKSGQFLVDNNGIDIEGNAYFDLTLNATPRTWYDFAVPFKVNRNSISLANGGAMPEYDIMQYNGATRAANGANKSAWEYVDEGDLNPGTFYMIMFASNVETIRFTKNDGADLNNANSDIDANVYESQTSNPLDANWNGIANSTLQYVNLGFIEDDNANIKAQVYNPTSKSYTPYNQNEVTFVVGAPFFVQVAVQDLVYWSTTPIHDILHAPSSEVKSVGEFTLELIDKGVTCDRLFVSASEDATDSYQVGHDLAKMGISTTIAQMWVDNYNTKLCANEAILYNGMATYQMGIFIPKEGEYTIAITNAPENAELYLLQDGQPIWNLSKGAYTAEFINGTHNEYSLMLQLTDTQTPTNLDGINGSDKAVKFLKNSDIYILRNAKLYNAQGQLVK